MRYLLDTNVIISILRHSSSRVALRLLSAGISQCCISDISLYELYCGAMWSKNPEKETARIDAIASQITVLSTKDCAREAARQKALLKTKGAMIEDFDILIAAAAIENNLTLVSANTKHMNRMMGLSLENWEENI